ncbi:MAG: alkaline phosphatase family protein [Brevundimonas sp.]|nr:alkaline phosphatase family protein [Brevundimonas sp.]
MEQSPSPSRRRLALVGIDGFSPEWIERFLGEGAMPHLAKLRSRGVTVPLVSTLPATTPVAWASIATGCRPSATGIEGFLLHMPGRPLDERIAGTYSTRCRREPVWETATLWGKRSYVVKFPLSYPSASATLRIDGAAGWGGIQCLHDAAPAGVADSAAPRAGHGRFVSDDNAARDICPGGAAWRGRLELPSLWGKAPVAVEVAVTTGDAPLLILGPVDPGGNPGARLAPGEWSQPIRIHAEGRSGRGEHAFRAKLLALEPGRGAAPRMVVFTTAVHSCEGHSHPVALADCHLSAAGPIEEQTEPSLLLEGAIDAETQLERCRLNTSWLGRLSTSILTNEPWDLFMVQIHIVDWAHHLLHGAVDPRHPHYDKVAAVDAEKALREYYRLADGLVGEVSACLSPGDDMMVLGDHGQDLHHTTVRVNEVLATGGLLTWADPDSLSDAVDWSKSRAYAAGNYIYVNLAGRDPGGVVPPNAYDSVVAEVTALMMSLSDPRTGEAAVLNAGPKSLYAALGADGAGVGDVVFCFRSGFHGRNDRGPHFELTRPLRDFTSGHDHFWPLDPRIETRMFAAGPSFRAGRAERRSIIDVAPTICAVLGIEPPLECEGSVIADALAPGLAPAPLFEPA